MPNPFRYFNSSPEVIRLAVMMYIRYPRLLNGVNSQRERLGHPDLPHPPCLV
jgi:hypothetical protein